jgi:hypothetical protein
VRPDAFHQHRTEFRDLTHEPDACSHFAGKPTTISRIWSMAPMSQHIACAYSVALELAKQYPEFKVIPCEQATTPADVTVMRPTLRHMNTPSSDRLLTTRQCKPNDKSDIHICGRKDRRGALRAHPTLGKMERQIEAWMTNRSHARSRVRVRRRRCESYRDTKPGRSQAKPSHSTRAERRSPSSWPPWATEHSGRRANRATRPRCQQVEHIYCSGIESHFLES